MVAGLRVSDTSYVGRNEFNQDKSPSGNFGVVESDKYILLFTLLCGLISTLFPYIRIYNRFVT